MLSKTNLDKINNLKHGESCTITLNACDDVGAAEVYRLHDTLFLFEIPQYGGEPVFFASYQLSRALNLLDDVKKWT